MAAPACSKRKRERPVPMEGAQSLEIVSSSINVLVGPVGAGRAEKNASYALVDVRNAGDHDLRVSLGGVLVDGAGNQLGPVRTEVLVIPGHGLRTFALVADPPRVLAGATSARPEVHRSVIFDRPPTVTIEDGQVY
ncbi:MAG: hypothetical protein KJO07_23715, partial [Deltaproteobacteria bacterium]|nr:hypothetical protein [Deltaproteobacteria bacterium]